MKWQPIKTAPPGLPSMDVGCRDVSEWFLGRIAKEHRGGRPEYTVIRRCAWPQEDRWECVGQCTYPATAFDGWMRMPELGFQASEKNLVKEVPVIATRGMIDAAADYSASLSEQHCPMPQNFRWHEAIEAAIRAAPSSHT